MMSNVQPPVKKSKKKKKKKTTPEPNPSVPTGDPAPKPPSTLANTICQSDADKENFNITEILPSKVGMKAVFNDVEVTMTHDGKVNAVESSKKKKKKKKNKSKSQQQQQQEQPIPQQQQGSELSQEPVPSVTQHQGSFFKFDKNHIELLNHPEISVTISKPPLNVEKVPEKVKNTSPSTSQQPETAAASDSTIKKKKNRKKKKKKTTTTEGTAATETATSIEATDTQENTPTYVKLPTDGDNCVLVVSHQSFSNNPATTSTSENKETGKTVLIQSKERQEQIKKANQMNFTETNSVNLIPIDKPDPSPMPLVNNPVISMDKSLGKISALVNNAPNEVVSSTTDTTEEPKTKAQLKAERRAKQEAQRAAKMAKAGEKDATVPPTQSETKVGNPKPKEVSSVKPVMPVEINTKKSLSKPSIEKELLKKAQLFSHLQQFKDIFAEPLNAAHSEVHPSILVIGSHFRKGILSGSNARCVAFLAAFQDVIHDTKTSGKELSKDLESKLQVSLDFLNSCRPLSATINSAVSFLKHQIMHLPEDIAEEEAKKELCLNINNFVKEEILLADKAICISTSAKIVDGDNILVHAYSSLVKDVLCKAYDQGKRFIVTIVDTKPNNEGLTMLKCLTEHGIQCVFIASSAVSYSMMDVTKVIVGAHALLSNGSVMSRLGYKQLAITAASYSIPVIACCETYKFCERALTDSFVHNELGNPNLLPGKCYKDDASKKPSQALQSHNVLYDVTPLDLITAVHTEKGILPCTSVPVVLRVRHAGLQE